MNKDAVDLLQIEVRNSSPTLLFMDGARSPPSFDRQAYIFFKRLTFFYVHKREEKCTSEAAKKKTHLFLKIFMYE